MHAFYKCWSAADLIPTKSDVKSTEQGVKQGSRFAVCSVWPSSAFRGRDDKQAAAWSQEATSWPLVNAAQLLWVNIITDLLGITLHVSILQKKNTRDTSSRWPSDYNETYPCYKSAGGEAAGHTRPSGVSFSGEVILVGTAWVPVA